MDPEHVSRVLEAMRRNADYLTESKRETMTEDVKHYAEVLALSKKNLDEVVAFNSGKRRVKSRIEEEGEYQRNVDIANRDLSDAERCLAEYVGEPVPTRDDAVVMIEKLILDFVKESQ